MRGGKGAEQKSPLEVAAPWGISITADLFISISFVENLCYNWFAALPAHFIGKGVSTMSPFLSLIQSVVVNIISHCVCKWLDGLSTGRKH